VFDPASKTFQNYQIPTATPGLKDGLTVAQDGAIWFTESGQQKIARLVLP
jgi:streptogramin lyase